MNFNLETPAPVKAKTERIRDLVTSPHVEAVLEIFKKRFKKEAPVSIETIKDILYTFFEQAVENTQIYSSDANGASFPYTVINTGALAKLVYSHYKIPLLSKLSSTEEKPKHRMEFVMGSFLDTDNGNQFTFFEEAMHQFVKQLPKALEDIAQGKEPENEDVYVLGSPTNELGTVSTEFATRIEEGNAFEQFGALYAEFITSRLPKEERKKTSVYLYGISMGGSLATQTAEQLLANGKVSQSREDNQEPFMQVRADTLPGGDDSPVGLRRWQIPFGFVADTLLTLATNPYTRAAITKQAGGKDIINKKIFANRGIVPNMTPDQVRMKKQIIYGGPNILSGGIDYKYGIFHDLREGVPIDPNLKLTEVRAKYDPLQYSWEFNSNVQKQRAERSGSLGENLVSEPESNRRVAAIRDFHTFRFFRENELRRIEKAAADLEKLAK